MDIPLPDSSVEAHNDLSAPPGDFEPPAGSSSAVALDASRGTSDYGPLPVLAGNTAAPLVNFNRPPGAGAAAAAPEPVIDQSPDRKANGSTATGTAAGDAGGLQGVPDGLPTPSVRNKKPDYPETAQRQGWTGTLYLELDLDERGRVTDARLLQSCGHDVLDKAALDAARTWRYTPATLNGRPVAVTVPVPIVYDLQSRRR